jgi:hypothetical protein
MAIRKGRAGGPVGCLEVVVKDKIKGKAQEAKGKVTDSKGEQAKGKGNQTLGGAKRAIKKNT